MYANKIIRFPRKLTLASTHPSKISSTHPSLLQDTYPSTGQSPSLPITYSPVNTTASLSHKPLHPSRNEFKLSRSRTSGYDPSIFKQTVKKKPETLPTRPQSFHTYKAQSTQSPPRKTIPLFHPDTPHVFMKCITRQAPLLRTQTLLSSLKNIPGAHKLTLLRALHNARLVPEATATYTHIVENGMGDQLSYVDHHRHIHLLKQLPLQHKQQLIHCWHEFTRLHVPAANILTTLFNCGVLWKDSTLADDLYEYMTLHSVSFECEAFNDYLYVNPSVEVWTKHISEITPTFTTIKRGLHIYALDADTEGVNTVYALALEHHHTIKSDYELAVKGGRQSTATTYTIALANAYMSALNACGEYTLALAHFNTLDNTHKLTMDTFNIAIQIALSHPTTSLKDILTNFRERNLTPDTVIYGKLIEHYGRNNDTITAKQYFDQACDELRVEVGGRKHTQLSTSLVHSYILADDHVKGVEVFESLQRDTPKGFRSTWRYGIAAYMGVKDYDNALAVLDTYRQSFTEDYAQIRQMICDKRDCSL